MDQRGLDHKAIGLMAGVHPKSVYDWLRGKGPRVPDQVVSLLTSGVEADKPKYLQDAAGLIAEELRRRPGDIEWVRALLYILGSTSEGSKVGIQENLNAFLVRLGRDEIPTLLTKEVGKYRARDAG
jgi:hypothetical protein